MIDDCSLFGTKVYRASVVFARIFIPAISLAGHLSVQPSPEIGRTGNVQDWHGEPEGRKAAGEIAYRVGPPVPSTLGVHHVHLFHQLVEGKIGEPFGDAAVVQRDEAQFSGLAQNFPPSVKLCQPPHLSLAKLAVSVVDHHVSPRQLVGIG